jgi:uncharacterized protein YqgC (DUF456 family)
MNTSDKKILRKNAQKINSLGADSIVSEVKTKMEDNTKGALLGGGIGLLVGIAMRKNLVVSGLIGIILGRFIFKAS